MTVPVGVAVVGAGYWGRKLVGEYLSSERSKRNIKLVKVCDSSPNALLACKEKFALDESILTSSFHALLGDPEISAIHIATPNPTHYELAKAALENYNHVLVEKPLTLNTHEAYDLVESAASRGLILHVGHVFRFNSALRKAREVLGHGRIGKVFYVRVQWTNLCPPFADRDIIFDLGPHPVDILNQLLDDWPEQVSCFARSYREPKNQEEVACIMAEFHNDVIAHIELSWLQPGKTRQVQVIGSDGALSVNCLDQRLSLYNNGFSEELPVTASNTIGEEINWFTDCIKRGDASSQSSRVGARTVEILDAIRASILQKPYQVMLRPHIDRIVRPRYG